MPDTTIRYYDENAEEYDAATVHLDMSELYEPFLAHIPEGGKILDLGCGPGRDVLEFAARGFDVTGIDASAPMVTIAKSRTTHQVLQMKFTDVHWQSVFDGVWACASLLHVPLRELPSVFAKVRDALKSGGVAYVSFKYGDSERSSRGRTFTDLSEDDLASCLQAVEDLEMIDAWITTDVRPMRRAERWLNAVLVKAR